MRAPSGRILEDGSYKSEFGYEARMGDADNLLAFQYAMDIENARGMRSNTDVCRRLWDLGCHCIVRGIPLQSSRQKDVGDVRVGDAEPFRNCDCARDIGE